MKILSELLEDVKVLESRGNVDVPIYSLCLDSRNIEKNSLFIAIIGNVVNGHSFINEVILKGAVAIIYENDLDEYKEGITYIKVLDTHNVSGIIAHNFYGEPSHKLKLIGITGTNGKTTTATLLHKLFRELGHKAGMIGTVVNKINDQEFEAIRTTPDSVSLNKLLAEMVDNGCEYCFMEVSSHAVSEKRISGLHFTGGLFTNLTLDHLDYHKTLDNYLNAKKGFFDIIPPSGFAIANIDDEKGEYILSNTKARKYFISLKGKSPVGLVASHQPDWCHGFNDRLETKLIGEFNIYNILGIYAIAMVLGQDDKKVREILKELDSVPGRFQSIKSKNNIIGIVDYAHTPDALENVLKTIQQLRNQPEALLMASQKSDLGPKIITVVGCGGDRDKSKRPIMARIGYDMSDILILTSDNPRSEKIEDILNDMQKGLPEEADLSVNNDYKVRIIIDRHQAIKTACDLTEEGDYILIAGKGHEKYQEINGLKTYFDDTEELEKYLLKSSTPK